MNEKQGTVTGVEVPTWYAAAIPALLIALALVVVLARATA